MTEQLSERKELAKYKHFTVFFAEVDHGRGHWKTGKYELEDDRREDKWSADGKYLIESKIVLRFERNYNSSCFAFFGQDGRDYLVASENYHGGITVIDLTGDESWPGAKYRTGGRVRYDPVGLTKSGQQHWCFGSFKNHDPEKKTIQAEGCYWAAPWDLKTFDVSNPMSLPWPELACEDLIDEADDDDE